MRQLSSKLKRDFILTNRAAFVTIETFGYNCPAAMLIDSVIRSKFGYSNGTSREYILKSFMRDYNKIFKEYAKENLMPASQIDYSKVAASINKKEIKPESLDEIRVFEAISRNVRVERIYKFLEGDKDARVCRW